MSTDFPWNSDKRVDATGDQPVAWRAVQQTDESNDSSAVPLTRRQLREQAALKERQGRLGRKKVRKASQRPPAHSSGRISKTAHQQGSLDSNETAEEVTVPSTDAVQNKNFSELADQVKEDWSNDALLVHEAARKTFQSEMDAQLADGEVKERDDGSTGQAPTLDDPAPVDSATSQDAPEKVKSNKPTPKPSFTVKDGATVALAAAALGLGTFTLIGDFSTPSTAYDDMRQTLRETTGEVTGKDYDEEFCPSDAYTLPFNSEERNRASELGLRNSEGKPVICLDPPYILEVTNGNEVTRLPVEQSVFESFEVGEQYAYSPEQYENLPGSVRTTLPDEERTGLKLSLMGAALLLAAGAAVINIYPSRHRKGDFDELDEAEEYGENDFLDEEAAEDTDDSRNKE